jgi:hypothetical protein
MTFQKSSDSVLSQRAIRNFSLLKQENDFFFYHVISEEEFQLSKLIHESENDRFLLRDVTIHNTEDCESRVLMIERSQR